MTIEIIMFLIGFLAGVGTMIIMFIPRINLAKQLLNLQNDYETLFGKQKSLMKDYIDLMNAVKKSKEKELCIETQEK